MDIYLECSEYIDWQETSIITKAKQLADEADSYNSLAKNSLAKKCFEFVRDEIKHAGDFQLNPVTCKASHVLHHGNGYCFAKSHLLAALLRANNIPAGLRYQRLALNDQGTRFSLHGLNEVYLEEFGWYVVDARGNNSDINTVFCPPKEGLAFNLKLNGEVNIAKRYSKPLDVVVHALNSSASYAEFEDSLPDIDPNESF